MTTRQIYQTIRKLKNGYNPRVADEEIEATIEAIKEMKSAYIEELKAAQEREAEYRLLLRRIGDNMMQQPVTLEQQSIVNGERKQLAIRIAQMTRPELRMSE